MFVLLCVRNDMLADGHPMQDDERFNLSAQEYLERYQIQVYVNDAIRSVLDAREERPLDTCLKYFNSVLQGNHVLLREFEFINATPRNRLGGKADRCTAFKRAPSINTFATQPLSASWSSAGAIPIPSRKSTWTTTIRRSRSCAWTSPRTITRKCTSTCAKPLPFQ